MNRDPALDTFLAEAAELLATMEGVLLRCEQGEQDSESINELFRAAHTIKGSAGLFGLDTIVGFTHVVESVLDSARSGGLPITAAAAAILLECSDHIGRLVGSIAAGGGADDPALLQSGLQILQRLTRETGFSPASAATKSNAAAPVAATAHEPDEGARAVTASWHISVRFADSVLRNGMDPLSFIRYLTTFGSISGLEVVRDALPALAQFDPESCYIGFEIGFHSDADQDRITAAFEFVRDDCTLHILAPHSSIAAYAALLRELPEPTMSIGERLVRCGTLTAQELALCLAAPGASAVAAPPSQAVVALPPPAAVALLPPSALAVLPLAVTAVPIDAGATRQSGGRRATDAQPAAAKPTDSHSIRVDGDKLDRLIDWIGELIIAGAATSSIARKAGMPVLQESALQLARIVGEIRDQALKLRMMQIGSTFSRFHRVVRDVARELGKNISLEVTGAETELDRTLVEGIADPLTHLVRNAIDHGIEMPEIRRARGKSATGVVRLNAYHDAGSVVIEVSDDGGGLKRDRILAKATERGLISPGEVLTDAQIYALIFEPGFSTAETVTNLSGRGVGMDVVKRNISALRGTVEVHSEEGKGSEVRIRLPLTLAIIEGFEVGVGRSHFVIPLDLVEECVDAGSGGDAQPSASAGHISLHGSVLPLIRLRDMFSIEQDAARRQSIVVVRSAGKRVGIMVDELLGELQAVIKPLSKLFSELKGIGGSTILGTGKVALILDIPGLIERTQARTRGADEAQRASMQSRDVALS
jgi:two-component system chemotaxis sensor kinase CheA